jgi:hypothetical protein
MIQVKGLPWNIVEHLSAALAQALEELPHHPLAIPTQPELTNAATYPPKLPNRKGHGNGGKDRKQNRLSGRVSEIPQPLHYSEHAGKGSSQVIPQGGTRDPSIDLLIERLTGYSKRLPLKRRLAGHFLFLLAAEVPICQNFNAPSVTGLAFYGGIR